MENNQPRTVKRYSNDFKKTAIALLQEENLTIDELSKKLEIPRGTLGHWVALTRKAPSQFSAEKWRTRKTRRKYKGISTEQKENLPITHTQVLVNRLESELKKAHQEIAFLKGMLKDYLIKELEG